MREVMLFTHFLGMLLAIGPIAIILFSGIVTSKMDKDQAIGFRHGLFRLVIIAHIGITLALVSGGYLMTPYWKQLGDMPLLIAKLIFYAVLLFTLSMISVSSRKARENQAAASIQKPLNWARISFIVGLAIIILATVIFK